MAKKTINVLMSLQDKFTAPLKKITEASKANEKQLKRASNTINNFAKDAGSKLASFGKGAVTSLGVAMGALVGYSTKVGIEFESAMSQVQAISGASGQALERLTEKAKEMGRTTVFSASESAEAMKYMAMAGWKEQDIINGIAGVMNLASASGESLGSVSDILTDAMTAFQMSADRANEFADVLAVTSSNANTNVGLMGYSFKQCGALAGTMGYSIQDLSLALGLMANAGIKGETAGMAIKNAIANMASPTEKMATVMDELGLSLTDADGNMKSFKTVIEDIRSSFSKLSQEEQASASANLFGKEAMAGMLSLVSASDADFNKLADAIANANGSAEQMATVMQDNLKGKIKSFQSVTEGMAITVYDKFKKPLTDALETVNQNFTKLSDNMASGEMSNSLNQLGQAVGSIAVAITNGIVVALPYLVNMFNFIVANGSTISALLYGIGAGFATFKIVNTLMALQKGLQGVSVATAILNAVMAVNPAVWVAVAVAGLVAGLILLWKNWDKVTEYLSVAWDKFKEFGNWLKDGFLGIVDNIAGKITGLVDGFKNLLGIGSKSEKETHNALGTSYFGGGSTYVNEGNRGELVNLPSGSQIVPHDLAVKQMSGSQNINISINVQGNVIANEDFYNECGRVITKRLKTALANM